MTDDELRETFHRFELRLERPDTKMDSLKKSLTDVRGEMRAMREGLETRLNSKAGNWVVSLWGAWDTKRILARMDAADRASQETSKAILDRMDRAAEHKAAQKLRPWVDHAGDSTSVKPSLIAFVRRAAISRSRARCS